ncbi:VPLPA-CTERM sorting domain-containing protein [Methylomonas sp. LL1]|uniref:VPLPA-CTERM sorting domain-containing protein n=1 Tax=Methylomonas sp. LL1 TaxID=2785785 RepID=UPI0018C44FAC|nr:VPLPA-CTERM sorting domain-containing protein [Methylomonas sp. LL1]QPK64004.1 VPLPA-CTERM sorting domain-containing protein [Methylomonas sp. LL1]
MKKHLGFVETNFNALTLYVILLAASPLKSEASLIHQSNFTTDTETGLDWLDLTVTSNRTYSEVLSDSILSAEGWHYARQSDLLLFINHVTGYDFVTYTGYNIYNTPEVLDPVIALLGDTYKVYFNSIGYPSSHDYYAKDGIDAYAFRSFGYLYQDPNLVATGNNLLGLIDRYIAFPTQNFPHPANKGYTRLNYTLPVWYPASADIGSFLIRDTQLTHVPLPPATLMFTSGLIGLGMLGRKKRPT